MDKPNEVLLAAAANAVIRAINFHDHGKIESISATYRSEQDGYSGRVYIPDIQVKMKCERKCCCDRK
jgi:hypothetical protein